MTEARAVWEIARKEVVSHIRTRRLLIIGSFFVLALVVVTIVLPVVFLDVADNRALFGGTDVGLENMVLLFFMSGFLFFSGAFYVQLLPIVLTADAVCSEWHNRTVFLLLSKPVSRTAFVLGKFAGSFMTVGGAVVGLFALDYLVLQPLLPGAPSASDVASFIGFLGILLLGVASFTGFALFLSTLTRSTVVSTIVAVASWIIVFPMIGRLDTLIALARFGTAAFAMSPAEAGIGWAQYLSPTSAMDAADDVLTGGSGGFAGLDLLSGGDVNVVLAAFALLAQAAVFVGLALLVVSRRDFE